MPRMYAEDTTVPVSRSRGEIDKLLRAWSCDGIQWTDDFSHNRILLRFVFARLVDGQAMKFMARFIIVLEAEEKIRERSMYRQGSVVKLAQAAYEKALASRGAREHRLLALWLKAAFNAVEAGIVAPEVLFLPFLEDKHGHTVAEIAVPKLDVLLRGAGDALLLGDGKGAGRG